MIKLVVEKLESISKFKRFHDKMVYFITSTENRLLQWETNFVRV